MDTIYFSATLTQKLRKANMIFSRELELVYYINVETIFFLNIFFKHDTTQ